MKNEEKYIRMEIAENDSGRRIDRVIRKFLKDVPLSEIYSFIRTGKIKLNGKKIKPETKTIKSDILFFETYTFEKILKEKKNISFFRNKDTEEFECELQESLKKRGCSGIKPPDKIKNINEKIAVILKTPALLFVNKKRGQTTHGKNSLDETVKKYFPPERSSLSFTIGALHRLDKDTTGLITFSQSLEGAKLFSKALRENKIEKYYLGINQGKTKKAKWETDIGNPEKNNSIKTETEKQKAVTLVFPLEYNSKQNISLTLFKLITGKKHQIRKQSAFFGFPLAGDKKYGAAMILENGLSYFLHAAALFFPKNLQEAENLPPKLYAPLHNEFLEVARKNFKTCLETETDISEIFSQLTVFQQAENI